MPRRRANGARRGQPDGSGMRGGTGLCRPGFRACSVFGREEEGDHVDQPVGGCGVCHLPHRFRVLEPARPVPGAPVRSGAPGQVGSGSGNFVPFGCCEFHRILPFRSSFSKTRMRGRCAPGGARAQPAKPGRRAPFVRRTLAAPGAPVAAAKLRRSSSFPDVGALHGTPSPSTWTTSPFCVRTTENTAIRSADKFPRVHAGASTNQPLAEFVFRRSWLPRCCGSRATRHQRAAYRAVGGFPVEARPMVTIRAAGASLTAGTDGDAPVGAKTSMSASRQSCPTVCRLRLRAEPGRQARPSAGRRAWRARRNRVSPRAPVRRRTGTPGCRDGRSASSSASVCCLPWCA